MRKDLLNQIGAYCKKLRGSRTQEELAKETGVSRSIISNIEGGRNFEARSLQKILNVLGGDLSSIFDTSTASARERELHERLHEMLQAEEPWPAVVAFNIDSAFLSFVARPKPVSSLTSGAKKKR